MEGRRGFLLGAAKLIGAGLTVAAVPAAMAKGMESLLWTPDREIIAGMQSGTTLSPYGPIYVTVHRGNPATQAICQWAVTPDGALLWESGINPSPIIFGAGQRLQRVSVFVDVIGED